MGDCTKLTWAQLTQRFMDTYLGAHGYSEHELKRIDAKWRQLAAQVGWRVRP